MKTSNSGQYISPMYTAIAKKVGAGEDTGYQVHPVLVGVPSFATKLRLGLSLLLAAVISAAITIISVSPKIIKRHPSPTLEQTSTHEAVVQNSVTALVPRQRIESGTQLESSMFSLERIPSLGNDENLISDLSQLKGTFARTTLKPHQALQANFLTKIRPLRLSNENIPQGSKIIAINIFATSEIQEWAKLGTRVNVAWLADAESKSQVLATNARVVSAERQVVGDLDEAAIEAAPLPTTANILVTIEEANRIEANANSGSLVLLLPASNTTEGTFNSELQTSASLNLKTSDSTKGSNEIEGIVRMEDPQNGLSQEWVVLKDGRLISKEDLNK